MCIQGTYYSNKAEKTDLPGKLHTGRSRNDQVATDMRIWLLEQVEKLEAFLKDLVKVMVARAESEIEHVMPGYTHLQVRSLHYGDLFGDNTLKIASCLSACSTYPMVALSPLSLRLLRQ